MELKAIAGVGLTDWDSQGLSQLFDEIYLVCLNEHIDSVIGVYGNFGVLHTPKHC